MIGAAVSTPLTCAAVNSDNTKTVGLSTCNAESDSDNKCCYSSYVLSGTTVRACVSVTNALFANLPDYVSEVNSANPGWGNYNLDCGETSYQTCSSANEDPANVSKENCNKISDSYSRCCYQSYKLSGTTYKSCQPILTAQFNGFETYFDELKDLNSAWGNYKFDCGQSFISLSLLVLAIFALMF